MNKSFLLLLISFLLIFSCDSSNEDTGMNEDQQDEEAIDNEDEELSVSECVQIANQIAQFTPNIADLTTTECLEAKETINNYINGGCTMGLGEIEKALEILGDCN